MKAAVLEQRGREGLRLRDFPRPVPAEGEALLRVHAVGLNRVDLYMRDNGAGITHALPLVQGVEAAGVVAEAPAGSGLKVGQKAILYSSAFCGHCRYCRAGDQPLCLHANIMGEHRHGTLAEFIAMPVACFFPLPDDADLVAAGALMVGNLTAWRMLFGKRALGACRTWGPSAAVWPPQVRQAPRGRRDGAGRRHRRRRRGCVPATCQTGRRARAGHQQPRRQDRAGIRAGRRRRHQLPHRGCRQVCACAELEV